MANQWTGGQYSLFRALFGVYLFVHFTQLLPWSSEVFSNEGVLPDGGLSPLFAAFPNLYALSDAPWFVHVTLTVAAGAALAFAAGWHDRLAALGMWIVLASLFGRNPLIANPSLPYVGFMLLAHLFVPAAPYGSAAARGRTDLSGGWVLPPGVYLAGWVVLAASYSYSGYTKLFSPSWVAGDTIRYVLEGPLARPWALRDFLLWLPPVFLTVLTWFVLYVELFFAPLVCWKRARPWAWLAMLIVQFGFLFLLNFADLTIAMFLYHLFTFDPGWFRRRPFAQGAVLYYDGGCAMCHGFVRFLLAEERTGTLRYAPLQGRTFRANVPEDRRMTLPDSIVLDSGDGQLRVRSDGIAFILRHMGGLWAVLGSLMWAVPRPIRNLGYDAIGAVRYRVFGRAPELCPLVAPELRTRVLAE